MKEFYIYGRPIETKIGKLHFMTVGEYYDFLREGHMNCLIMTKQDLLKRLKDLELSSPYFKPFVELLEDNSLFEFLKNIEYLVSLEGEETSYHQILIGLNDLYLSFRKLFEFCFKEDVFDKISNNDEFEEIRDLIVEINCFPYEKPNPNPEIERYNQMRRLMQKQRGEGIDFESMYTSVGLAFGKDPDDMTMYKFNKYFSRLAQFKNYDTTTLFATVCSDVKIENWYKPVEEKEISQQTISEDELKRKSQNKL